MAAGKAFLHDGSLYGPDEIRKKIEAVTGEDILQVAHEIFDPEKLSMLIFQNNNIPNNHYPITNTQYPT